MANSPVTGQRQGQPSMAGGIKPRDVAGYVFLPRITNRFADLFFSGFTLFAFFMAQVYRGARLLPESHPYLSAANIGRFGVRDVIGAAASHLVFRKENIDQIIIFFALLIGLILLILQAAIFLIMLASPEASAQGLGNVFGDPVYTGTSVADVGTKQDLAFIMLDRVFGVEGIFNSCISNKNVPCYGIEPKNMVFDTTNTMYKPPAFPWPYHLGLHAMFKLYSLALLMVGALIILYYAVVVVVETAQTGTPFGKRFNTVWAPIRLVLAIGLLIPMGTGLNAAQYITLYVAKFGSNFASNGWLVFQGQTQGAAKNMAGGQALSVQPQEPEVMSMIRFMTVAHACKAMEEILPVADWRPPETKAATPAATPKGGAATPKAGTTSPAPTGTTPAPSGGTPAPTGTTPAPASQPSQVADAQKAQNDAFKCNQNNKNINFEEMSRYRHIDAYLVNSSFDFEKTYKPLAGTSYDDALKFSGSNGIKIRFGDQSCRNVMHSGFIAPLCGEVVLPAVALDSNSAKVVQKGYFELLQYMWGGYGAQGLGKLAETYTNTATEGQSKFTDKLCNKSTLQTILNSGGTPKDVALRARGIEVAVRAHCSAEQQKAILGQIGAYTEADLSKVEQAYRLGAGDPKGTKINSSGSLPLVQNLSGFTIPNDLIVTNIIRNGVKALQEEIATGKKYNISPDAMARGWAAAGVWYNKIAQMNGTLVGAAWGFPAPTAAPRIVQLQAASQALNANTIQSMIQKQGGQNEMISMTSIDKQSVDALVAELNKISNAQELRNAPTGNVFGDIINNLFGIDGLFNMNSPANREAHPLAQLVGVGKGLIEASIRNLTAGVMFGGMGVLTATGAGFAKGMGSESGAAGLEGITGIASSISGLMFTVATITLTAGFILYYVIPFLPFLYFFFAVGNWLKGVFEAMVGTPLWALAHLRIDGQGLPGEAAINGYFMLFEICLRPILIVFGLLASITIFAAMGAVLSEVYQTVIGNLTGANPEAGSSSSIDKLFYTIMYAVVMYMMALSSFKLIDLIPQQIMRWMGTNASTFSDQAGDPAQTLTQYTAIAGSQIVGQVTGGTEKFISGIQAAGRSGGQVAGAAARATS